MRVSKCDKCGAEIGVMNPVLSVTYHRGTLRGYQTVDLCRQCHRPFILKLQRERLLKKDEDEKKAA